MAIIKRAKRETPFVQMDKTPLQDKNLSWKAKGVLAYLLSLPDDWEIFLKEIVEHATDGKDSTKTAFDELIKAGYVTREEAEKKKGKYAGYNYTVSDYPQRFVRNGKPATTNKYITNNTYVELDSTVQPEEDKETIPIKEIVSYLNEKTGKKFKASTKATQSKIKARWKEGFRLDDFKKVIDCKNLAWGLNPKMKEYLRPETLFGTKFESYLNACNTQPEVNAVHDLTDIQLTEEQGHTYLDYHQHIKEYYPNLYQNVTMLRASEYFEIRPGGAKYDGLRVKFSVRELKNMINDVHREVENGLIQGRSYPDVYTMLKSKMNPKARTYA